MIDLSAYSVVKTIRTGSLPNYGVSIGDGKRVYVSNSGDDTIAEIDAESWTFRRHIPAGTNPEHIIPSRDDSTLNVSNVAAGTVSEIALAEGRVTRTFEIGGTLHGIDLSDNQGTLFVSAMERNELVAVDRTSAAVRSVALGPSPYHLTIIRGTGKVYVSSAEEPKLWVVDAATLRVRRKIPIRGKGHQIAVSEGRNGAGKPFPAPGWKGKDGEMSHYRNLRRLMFIAGGLALVASSATFAAGVHKEPHMKPSKSSPATPMSIEGGSSAEGARGLLMPMMNPARGRALYVSKGCVVCHSINGVGGEGAPPLDASNMPAYMNPFEFAARMWRGSATMVALQEETLGEQIEFTGEELANITAFVHDADAQKDFSDSEIPPRIREMMEHTHEEGGYHHEEKGTD